MNILITVPDMMCQNCEKKLTGLAAKLPGIKTINANHETHLLTVEFDNSQLSVEKIVAAVTELGFHPEFTPI
jgi:copper chaperone